MLLVLQGEVLLSFLCSLAFSLVVRLLLLHAISFAGVTQKGHAATSSVVRYRHRKQTDQKLCSSLRAHSFLGITTHSISLKPHNIARIRCDTTQT